MAGRRTSAAAARHTGERWPCHLRCDARACTRAHARALHAHRARHALHARTLETLNGGWPGGCDGGGRARLPQTAARCAAERWPCHLRCHARACTRARSARMRARKKRSGWHRTSTAAAARRAAERWTRHLRCNTRAIRVRMRVLCTSAVWMACTKKTDRAGGRVAHTRTPAFGGLPDPSHGIEPRLAPSCFCRFACCAPSPAAAQLRSCMCVQTDAC